MPKIRLQGYMVVSNSEIEAVLGELNNHIALTLQEPGCLGFKVKRRRGENIFDVFEEFQDRSAFDAHQERVKSSRWGALTQQVERHYEVTEV